MGVVVLAATLTGCAVATQPATAEPRMIDSGAVVADLTPDIEALYLSWHALDLIYKDIKFLERGFLFDPDDRQLGYVQKAALYVQDASVRIHHQWEQLSVLHYIRPQRMRDYLTLRVKGLTSTIKEIGYDDKFVDIYAAFILHEAVSQDLNRARHQMRLTSGLLDQIRQKLLPHTNATTPSVAI